MLQVKGLELDVDELLGQQRVGGNLRERKICNGLSITARLPPCAYAGLRDLEIHGLHSGRAIQRQLALCTQHPALTVA